MATPNVSYSGGGLIRHGSVPGAEFIGGVLTPNKYARISDPGQIDPTMTIPFDIVFDSTDDGTTTQTIIASVPFTFKVVDVAVQATANSGGGTVMLMNGTNAITDAIICAVDTTVTRAGTIDKTYAVVATGAALKIVKNAAADVGLVTVKVIPAVV